MFNTAYHTPYTRPQRPAIMKGKSISEDLAWTIVWMVPLLGLSDIKAYMLVSKAQIKRILARWRATGSVKTPRDCETRGWPRHLTPEDVNICPILSSSFLLTSQTPVYLGHRGQEMWYVPGWTTGESTQQLWSRSILTNGLASIEKEWIQHEEGIFIITFIQKPTYKNQSSQRQP